MKEEIKQKFGAIANEYNNQRKSVIPCFDDFYGSILECITYNKSKGSFLDIGAGTGLLTSFIHNIYPDSKYTLIDISDEMIDKAKQQFNGIKGFEFIVADYANYEFKNTYDVVVSSLSIHHITDTEKRQLNKKIYSIINPGGIFINGDILIHKSAFINEKIKEGWIAKIRNSNLEENQKDAAIDRMKLDKPATSENNILWMEEAGFKDVELIYKYFPFGVICGFK
jgi:tRNA (cmo5U34)-methyltransferase